MSNVIDMNEWLLDKFEQTADDWEDIYNQQFKDVTVHTLVAKDRNDKEFLDLRAFLDGIGAMYTVRSTPPEPED